MIDDDSIQRAVVTGGRLEVADESYGVVVLPAATVLDEVVAERLDAFAAAGGRLIAVEALPDSPRLRRRFEEGTARFAASAADLERALAGFVPRVEAPVPPLVREVDGTTVVFLTAAFPAGERDQRRQAGRTRRRAGLAGRDLSTSTPAATGGRCGYGSAA